MKYIQDIGAIAGFASMIGLAVLALLYFSQARDLRRLRDWAGHAPERAKEAADQPAAADPYLPTEVERSERPDQPSLADRISPRTVAIVLAGVLILAALAFGALQLFGSNESGSGAASSQGQRTGDAPPSQITVAVLNGTSVPGLASKVGSDLKKAGFKLTTITNANQQDIANTTVAYTKGQKLAGVKVSKQLGVDPPSPLSPQDAALAGDADVVVTVGSDRS